jgi:hyperosmotically inducible periplasmic protein
MASHSRRARPGTPRGRGHWRRALLLAGVVVMAVGGCASIDPLEDTRIEAEVKARLVAKQDANLTRLGVLSSQGDVYLSGSVESAEQKAQAEAVARGVQGVRRVVNTLEVRPAFR